MFGPNYLRENCEKNHSTKWKARKMAKLDQLREPFSEIKRSCSSALVIFVINMRNIGSDLRKKACAQFDNM